MNRKYEEYRSLMQKISDVSYANALLSWDQEVSMPPKGAAARARQSATLSGITHDLFTGEKTGTLLEELSGDKTLSFSEARNVAETYKSYKKAKKYSTDFVITLSKTISESFEAWNRAKKENNFSIFAPLLEKIIKLKREEAGILGYTEHPYDALLDQFEPEAKTKDVERIFEDVKKELVPFVKEIATHPQPEQGIMFMHYPRQKQWDLGIELLKQMGYDFEAGRQDISTHPFTTNFGALDVRVTTRINEHDLGEMLWSCIHEGGHALYEQGLNNGDYGLPSSESISLGIHESQSRLWENNVGRSLPYWKANFPRLQQIFPENLGKASAEDFYKAMNTVKPSLIRTSADELTYHFHILIRFELEKALIEGSLEVKDLTSAWNKKYKEYLGVDVPSDSKGVLQDIHWSHGLIGYFPTYSLGSFYAAQFYSKASADIPGLEDQISKGQLKPLLGWLRENIHQHGKLYSSEEISKRITGEKLNFKYFLRYAKNKYAALYNLKAETEKTS